jgi:hypothetical protein
MGDLNVVLLFRNFVDSGFEADGVIWASLMRPLCDTEVVFEIVGNGAKGGSVF